MGKYEVMKPYVDSIEDARLRSIVENAMREDDLSVLDDLPKEDSKKLDEWFMQCYQKMKVELKVLKANQLQLMIEVNELFDRG